MTEKMTEKNNVRQSNTNQKETCTIKQTHLQNVLEIILSNKYGCEAKITVTKKGATDK